MATEDLVKNLQAACESIENLVSPKDGFVSRPDWGEITFKDIESYIDSALWLVGELKRLPVQMMPDEFIQSVINDVSQIRGIFNEINQFTVFQENPPSVRDDISRRLRAKVQSTMQVVSPWVPLLLLRTGEIKNVAAEIKDVRDKALEASRKMEADEKKFKEESDKAMDSIRTASARGGAAQFTEEFNEEARAAKERSGRWLGLMVTFATLALLLSGVFMLGLFFDDAPTNAWEAAYRLSGRVFAILILFYAVVWSSRIVLSNMHLESVNKHRAVSLQTLQAFHNAAEDATVKDAVVLEAARAVYENVPSGYIGRQTSGSGGNVRTLEVVKNITPASRVSDGD